MFNWSFRKNIKAKPEKKEDNEVEEDIEAFANYSEEEFHAPVPVAITAPILVHHPVNHVS